MDMFRNSPARPQHAAGNPSARMMPGPPSRQQKLDSQLAKSSRKYGKGLPCKNWVECIMKHNNNGSCRLVQKQTFCSVVIRGDPSIFKTDNMRIVTPWILTQCGSAKPF